jgi:hypothetical protein
MLCLHHLQSVESSLRRHQQHFQVIPWLHWLAVVLPHRQRSGSRCYRVTVELYRAIDLFFENQIYMESVEQEGILRHVHQNHFCSFAVK